MVNEIVKHHNDLNSVIMRKWTPEEMNFFFSVIAKAKNKGTQLLHFDTDELREISGFADLHKERWNKTISNVADKVSKIQYIERTESRLLITNLFSHFDIDFDNKTLEVGVSHKFEYVLNKLEANFTQYELEEFTQIRSTYAKTAYRLLKQWRTVGRREFKIDEFRSLLDTPKYYQISDIERLVIKPIKKELPQYFPNLKVKKVKSNKRGNPVIAYEFTWEAEKTAAWKPGKFKTPKNPSKKLSNVPEWHEGNYINETTEDDQKRLEEAKKSLLEKVRK